MSQPGEKAVAVLGAGSWGTALAILLSSEGQPVRLWGHLKAEVDALAEARENRQFLPGLSFPDSLTLEADLKQALYQASEVVIAVPSHAFSSVTKAIEPLLDGNPGIA
ncbi:MAG: 2-dehydropantoate 2-reductase N-terminal domain-containing protein, partial [Candidatus Thiodiazotropha sp. 6PLUC4]